MWMRPKLLVTPRGRMASNSGCTEVLVEGAITPNFLRKPSESVMGGSLPQVACGRQWHRLHLSLRARGSGDHPPYPQRRGGAVLAVGAGRCPRRADMLEF